MWSIMPMASGSIIAAVAVLLIHMESTAVAANSSMTAADILPRESRSTPMAIFLSSRCTCSAAAKAKPPKNT